MSSLLFMLCVCLLSPTESLWVMDWFWKSSPPEKEVNNVMSSVPLTNVPYEAKTEDEKFLEAAKKYTDMQLSELDSCQHKIVLHIRSSCAEMSDEELAKMSVNLLNCQSAVEGRQLFPCTESMSLRECTSAMDPDIWNTYHLMSNRARAVCYAARQQQFRALSEMTVNKLMHTAHDQLQAMEKLKEGQQKLESFTVGTIKTIADGQDSLLQQQERLRVTQQNMKTFVSANLHELTKEKALIAAGHKELSKMTEDIKTKLDSASDLLMHQSDQQLDNHKAILKDLEDIKEHAKVVWQDIELSMQLILSHHETATLKYEETLEKLTKINETVNFLLQLMEVTHSELNERLGWLSKLVGAAGLYTFSMHVGYLLVGMIATAFLQAPPLTKLCLLLIVPLNLSVIYHHGFDSAMDYASMTMLILFSTLVHWITSSILMYTSKRKHSTPLGEQKLMNGYAFIPSATVIKSKYHSESWWSILREVISNFIDDIKTWFSQLRESAYKISSVKKSERKDMYNDSDDSGSDSDISQPSVTKYNMNSYSNGLSHTRSSPAPVYQRVKTYMSPPTPPASFSRGTSRNSSVRSATPRPQCVAICRSGLPCRNSAVSGSSMCRVHINET